MCAAKDYDKSLDEAVISNLFKRIINEKKGDYDVPDSEVLENDSKAMKDALRSIKVRFGRPANSIRRKVNDAIKAHELENNSATAAKLEGYHRILKRLAKSKDRDFAAVANSNIKLIRSVLDKKPTNEKLTLPSGQFLIKQRRGQV